MDSHNVALLDEFEDVLNMVALERDTHDINPDEYKTLSTMSLSLNNIDAQKSLGEYLTTKLKIFSDDWSAKLEAISAENQNEKLLQAFLHFWSSVQVYIFTKYCVFGEFLSTSDQARFIFMAFQEFKKELFAKNILHISKALVSLINQDRQDFKVPRDDLIAAIQNIQDIGLGDDIQIEKNLNWELKVST